MGRGCGLRGRRDPQQGALLRAVARGACERAGTTSRARRADAAGVPPAQWSSPDPSRPPAPAPTTSTLPAGGQESAGIATFGETGMYVQKGMGLVSQVFTEADMESLKGA